VTEKPDIDVLIAQVYESVKNGQNGVAIGVPGSDGRNGNAPPQGYQPMNVYPSPAAQKRRRTPSPVHQSYGEPPSSQPQPLAHKKSKHLNGSARGISDEELARQLSLELNGRSTRGGGSAAPSGSKAAKPKATTKKAKRSKATINSDEDDDEGDGRPKKTKGGLGKEYLLSEPLAQLTGHAMLSRPQTVKKLWEHIKGNNLQNPEDKREIMCDPPMKAVFHTDRLNMFKMNKLLGQHLFEPGESTAA